MALQVTATVTRTSLGLSTLNINDHVNYTLSDKIMGAGVSWDRRQVSSPWVDGDITLSRRLGTVMEPVMVNVYGDNQSQMRENLETIIDAFSQHSYTLTIKLGSTSYGYSCEAADYSVEWSYKMHSSVSSVTFQVPRKPEPSRGGV